MKPTRERFRNSAVIANSRWITYATAGAASALTCLPSTEAEIHYSGIVHRAFEAPPQDYVRALFPLDSGVNLSFVQFNDLPQSAGARLRILGAEGSAFVAKYFYFGGLYASKLAPNLSLSSRRFKGLCNKTTQSSQSVCYGATIGNDSSVNGQFKGRGTGIIGFSFNRGAGIQYGWARIRTTGEPKFRFILVDYAWGDPGDKVKTGQKSSPRETAAVPSSGSLGLLAVGAAGLVAWRRWRGQATSPG
jgi:hypothetical protein